MTAASNYAPNLAMKRFFAFVGLSAFAALLPCAARADVAWQHAGDVQVGSRSVFSFNVRNEWSGDRHRAKVFADARAAARLAAEMGASPSPQIPRLSTFSIVERLDDDKILLLVPSQNGFVEEPYSTLAGRLRFDIWPEAAQSLNEEVPPQLSYEQRRRLGRELRSSLRPFTSRLTRTYFRPLPQTRVIEGLTCRGYRYTTLLGMGFGDPPLRISAEWWIAPPRPEDEVIASFTRRALALRREAGPLTLSMWANETYPIIWQALPQEFHQGLETLVGQPASGNYEFKGTPTQFFVTVTPPPLQQLATGQIRFRSRLTSRSTEAIAPETFTPPAAYRRQPLEPLLQIVQGLINQAQDYSEAMLDAALGARAGNVEAVSSDESAGEAKTTSKFEEENQPSMNQELKIEDLREGTGATAQKGDEVVVNYRGTLLDGTQFDASYGRAPFEFKLGAGRVIKGWDQGVPGMKVGGQRKLTIPAELAYGNQSVGGVIPANSTLVFEIELLEIR